MKKTLIILTLIFSALIVIPASVTLAWDGGGFGDCCGGDDYGGDDFGGGDMFSDPGDSWNPGKTTPTPTPAPTCSISATPNPVNYDGTVTLKWTTSNATGASINGIGYVQVGANKTMTVPHLKSNTTYTMTVTGAGGTKTCKVTVTVKPKPSCTITANPSTVDKGGNVTLSWTTKNASSASISGIGTVGLNGSYTVSNLQSSKTYTMTVSGNGTTATCKATVKVNEPQVPDPSCTISANPSVVSYGGGTTLTWSSSNAVSASIDGIGAVSLAGSRYVSDIRSDKTFTMTVKNSAGVSKTCSVHVDVSAVQAPSCTLRVTPRRVEYGDDVTLVWSSSNAVSASLSDGIGTVSLAGSKVIYNVRERETYVLTVTGQDGTTATCRATVRVEEEDLSCSIWASPNPNSDGTTTLRWNSDGASWAIINNGIGSVSPDGQMTLTNLPNGTKVYTMTVGTGHGSGKTRTCSVTVRTNKTVTPPPAPTYPSCTITASRTYIKRGEGSTLYWTSQNAVSAIFTNNGTVPTVGSKVVYPSQSGYYKLIVTDSAGHQASCQTYITVEEAGSTVTVSSVPYTGPEDGIYLGIISLVFFGAIGTMYTRRRQIMGLVKF